MLIGVILNKPYVGFIKPTSDIISYACYVEIRDSYVEDNDSYIKDT